MYRTIGFVLVSAGIIAFSWPYLTNPRHHGFYRFFAFECVMALFLLNVPFWIEAPFTLLHLLAWVLLILSGLLAIHGFYLLKRIGQPQGPIEDTTRIVTVGAYRYIRHPLYASLLYFGWGSFLKNVSVWSVLLIIAATAFLYLTARTEERENIEKFGDAYQDYMKESKMFIPYVL